MGITRGLLFLVASVASVYGAIKWSDCAKNPGNTTLTVNTFDISPAVINFPGQLDMSLNITVNRRIEELFIDMVLVRQTVLGGIEIPCLGETNIGTCSDIEACSLLTKIKNGSSVISPELGMQIDELLFASLGHYAQCPINPENIVLDHANLELQALPEGLLELVAAGNYTITLKIKETKGTQDYTGCFTFDAGIDTKEEEPGLLFA